MIRVLSFLVFSLFSSGEAVILCQVDRQAYPSFLPGIYRVVISVKSDCPPEGYAVVRLVSGRQYPWEVIWKGHPYEERGVPWYWKGQSLSNNAKVYTFDIPGMRSPFGKLGVK